MAQPQLSQVHINRAISNVAIRYSNQQFIAGRVAPVVPVAKRSDKYFKFGRAAWFRDAASVNRRPGARAPRGGYPLSDETYDCKEMAFAHPIPDQIFENADDPLKPYENGMDFCMQMVMLRLERLAAANLFVSSTWNSGTDHTVTYYWNDYVNSDPAADVATGKEAILKATGFDANRLLIGVEVFNDLRLHPDALDRFKHTQVGVLNEAQIAQWLDVQEVVVGRSVYETAEEDATSSPSFVWGKNALLSYVPANPAIDVPAAAYTFRKGNVPETKQYREEAEAQEVVEAKIEADVKRTAVEAGYYYASIVS